MHPTESPSVRMVPRLIEKNIISAVESAPVVVLYGPRQVGKTTLVRKIAQSLGNYIYLNCDEPDVREALTEKNSTALRRTIGEHTLVIVDEAQRVPNIGLTLKLIVDNQLAKSVLATGSSSLELANRISEPLT